MTKRRSVKFAAGVVAISAICVGLGTAGAVAASQVFSANDESKAVIEDAAEQLGVEPDALSDALKQALKNRIDAAVEAGRLTEAQGAELKERIDSKDGLPLFGGMRHGGHGPGFAGPFGSLDAAAAYLGLTEAELRDQLADKTLAEIAKDREKSVDGLVKALATAAEKRIDEAVADGRLTEEHANELKSELDDRIEALVNGKYRGHGRGFHPGFGHGNISPRGPPGFEGPHA
jgi:D-serine deaminase-like pyridoxal phosphate-dependent protein